MTPSISVAVPSRQRRESLRRLLLALGTQTIPGSRFEVVVCLDGCDDGSLQMIDALSTPYALHTREQPGRGRAAACNEAIRAASGAIVVILDDDMEPAPRLLEAHLAAHERAAARGERLALLGAAPVILGDRASPAARYVAAKFGRHLRKIARPEHRFALRDFYTGNFSIRRDTLFTVGLFDESFREYGNEDLELCVRLVRSGVRIRFDAAALAEQHYEKDVGALVRDSVAKGRTASYLARLHPEVASELQVGSWRRTPLRVRAPVTVLLGLTRAVPSLPARIPSLLGRISRSDAGAGRLAYEVALAYAYWLGAREAREAQP